MSSNDNLKSKPDIGFFNSDIISDNEMEIDDTEENDLNKNESKKEQIPTSNQNVQKSKTQKVIHISAPTLSEIESDVLTKLANLNWNNTKSEYLLPFYTEDVDELYILSIVIVINEKFRQKLAKIWDIFINEEEKFQSIFKKILTLLISPLNSEEEQIVDLRMRRNLLIFLINCFQSLENAVVRVECMKIVSLPIWKNLTSSVRDEKFKMYPQFKKLWDRIEKKYKKSKSDTKETIDFQRNFFLNLFKIFITILDSIPLQGEAPPYSISFCERFLELLIDLETQLPTRRFFNILLNDLHIIPLCYNSNLAKRGLLAQQNISVMTEDTENIILFIQLLDILKFYSQFEINDFTGYSLSDGDMTKMHYSNIKKLQLIVFSKFSDELKELALSNVGKIEKHEETLHELCEEVGIRVNSFIDENKKFSVDLLKEVFISKYEKRPSQIERINEMPLYPDENTIFDESLVPPTQNFSNIHCLAIPKLNLQFLTLHDYLLRNFNLFRLESAFEIRQDIEDVIKRLGASYDADQQRTVFSGWSRMAVEILSFNIIEIGPPKLGENKPSYIKADVEIDTKRFTDSIRKEWDSLRPHDILFLLDVHAKEQLPGWVEYQKQQENNVNETSSQKIRNEYGLGFVRGCEIIALLGEDGNPIDEALPYVTPIKSIGEPKTIRSIRVLLDPNQYKMDIDNLNNKQIENDVYNSFTILMRRKPKENNFKAVLETIRDLMQTELVVPNWLHEIFLGYGNPNGAEYTKISNPIRTIDFCDTFLDWEHLTDSFPNKKIVTFKDDKIKAEPIPPPYVITYPKSLFESDADFKISKQLKNKRKLPIEFIESEIEQDDDTIIVETYKEENKGPYLEDKMKTNSIKFTPTQVEAIHSGTSPGLTMIVGPPGTGKTDVAVQIISNIYHNYPEQHTLLVTHSNQALNQLFEKIVELDINPCHLLRLGHGEEELNIEGTGSWGKYGRVNSYLEKRLELLDKVNKLAKSLDIPGEHGYTCETASYFYQYHIVNIWENYHHPLKQSTKQNTLTCQDVIDEFPFKKFFEDAPQPLFPEEASFEEALEIAEGCFYHIKKIFEQLDEIRAFELLRTNSDRANYLLVKEAKIVTMTCTHAALKRRELVALGFKYDNVIMEESAQILEVETFIPLLLQSSDEGESRLKRVILIGDHNQLPPVVKSMAFQKYGNMEQSLFTRFIRLGVPYIELDKQARARSSIAELYRWKYRQLGDLESVLNQPEFKYANPGFAYDYQFIDIKDGKESEPIPYFYQNVNEAEMVVATFQYMRILGYPADKITILTTYNGQKQLIRDVLRRRCSWNPIFGKPHKVTTVDKYQGQQNDFVLLSLVRTKNVGHLRDPRRLIVAMSRARLGLYVFGCLKLFSNCYELKPTFEQFLKRPTSLIVHANETYSMLEDAINQSKSSSDDMEVDDNNKRKKTITFRKADCYDMTKKRNQLTQDVLEYMKTEKLKEEEKNKKEKTNNETEEVNTESESKENTEQEQEQEQEQE
ncbi:P-loop containing nucleoside triphosphate hydrolase protein [Neocallimastix californiae]|uniref:Pre-mRNA-splicing factor n=1 Tax=Neocallimastix californiae TaxID=1754190 RepID=A0A1Y2FV91_9FUNG|nr:P-loop containing nucleoside triphosphate hydrolase protein [Neocallimastix californiae]|eukprot:ORY86605.1 P-loop containing nucleoside triphosphate hydrolase protein [Neocallimastix californiae]